MSRIFESKVAFALAIMLVMALVPAALSCGGASAATTVSGEISGNVSVGATPIEGILVGVIDVVDASYAGSELTDAAGNFAVSGLHDGSSYKLIFADLTGQYAVEFYSDQGTYAAGNVVQSPAINIDEQLEQAVTITGTVTDAATGQQVSGCGVSWFDSTIGSYGAPATTTDGLGFYTLHGLKSGTDYKVSFTLSPYNKQWYHGKADWAGADLVPAGSTGIDVALVRPPMKSVVIGVQPASGQPGSTVTISGSDFGASQGRSAVTIGGVPASVVSWSDTTIVATVGYGAASGSVVVTTAQGGSNTDNQFSVVYPTWYLAEGSSAWGFSTYIAIENPNSSAVTARVTYMVPVDKAAATGRGIALSRTVELAPSSQTVINPGDDLPWDTDFSTKVECLEGKTIAVDRTMTFALAQGDAFSAHSSIGVNAPAKTWFLPEGSSAWGFDDWTLIQNPGAVDAGVTLTYMTETGPRVFKKTVAAGSRATFNMKDDIGEADASLEITSDQPVIPERSMYERAHGNGETNSWREGACSIGTTAASVDCFLAEGTTAWGFTTYVMVQNPNSREASVNLTCNTPRGAVSLDKFIVPASSRKTLRLNDLLPDTDCSIEVHGSLPIVAERSMYWPSESFQGLGMTDSVGVSMPHATWYLPSGQNLGGETYTCVQNPNPGAVTVQITYLRPSNEGSSNVTFADEIPAGSRKTYNMADKEPSTPASVIVTSKDAARPIVVEGSTYFEGGAAGCNTIGAFSD